jgi:tetratricopeptide (TPR) repeat protein
MRRAAILLLITAALAIAGGAQRFPNSGQFPNAGQFPNPGELSTFLAPVEGQLEDTNGRPLAAAVVQLLTPEGMLLASTTTSADGSFSFSQPADDGAYVLKIEQGDAVATESILKHGHERLRLQVALRRPSQPRMMSSSLVSVNDLEVPNAARKSYSKALKEYHHNRYDHALMFVNAAIARAPRWSAALLFRGVLLLQQRSYDEAANTLMVAVESNPYDGRALTALGSAYQSLNQESKAEFYLQRATQVPLAPWQSWFELSNLHLHQRKYAQAEKEARNAIRADANASPLCHYLMGQAAIGLVDYRLASDELTEFVRLAPESPRAAVARQQLTQMAQQTARAR